MSLDRSDRAAAARRLARLLTTAGVYAETGAGAGAPGGSVHSYLMRISDMGVRQRAEFAEVSSRSTTRTNSGSTAEADFLLGSPAEGASNEEQEEEAEDAAAMGRWSDARPPAGSFASVGSDGDFVPLDADDEEEETDIGSGGNSRPKALSSSGSSCDAPVKIEGNGYDSNAGDRDGAGSDESKQRIPQLADGLLDLSMSFEQESTPAAHGHRDGPPVLLGGAAKQVGRNTKATTTGRSGRSSGSSGGGGGTDGGTPLFPSGNDKQSALSSSNAVPGACGVVRTLSGTAMPAAVRIGQLDLSARDVSWLAEDSQRRKARNQDLNRRNFDHPIPNTPADDVWRSTSTREIEASPTSAAVSPTSMPLELSPCTDETPVAQQHAFGSTTSVGSAIATPAAPTATTTVATTNRAVAMSSSSQASTRHFAHTTSSAVGSTDTTSTKHTPSQSASQLWSTAFQKVDAERGGPEAPRGGANREWRGDATKNDSNSNNAHGSSAQQLDATPLTKAGGHARGRRVNSGSNTTTERAGSAESLVGVWRRRPSPASKTSDFVAAMRFPKPLAKFFDYMRHQMFRLRWVGDSSPKKAKSRNNTKTATPARASSNTGISHGASAAPTVEPASGTSAGSHGAAANTAGASVDAKKRPRRKKKAPVRGFVECRFMRSPSTPLSLGMQWHTDTTEHLFEPRIFSSRSPGASQRSPRAVDQIIAELLDAKTGACACGRQLPTVRRHNLNGGGPLVTPQRQRPRRRPQKSPNQEQTPDDQRHRQSPTQQSAALLSMSQSVDRREFGGRPSISTQTTVKKPPRSPKTPTARAQLRGKKSSSILYGLASPSSSPYRRLGPGPLTRIVELIRFSAAQANVRYYCCQPHAGLRRLMLRVYCDGDGLDIIQRKLEYKLWPWNDVMLCRVTLEEEHYGRAGSSFWIKVGTSQEVYERCQ